MKIHDIILELQAIERKFGNKALYIEGPKGEDIRLLIDRKCVKERFWGGLIAENLE